MSRIRIVKGVYNKITHGNHNMFSERNIESYAGNVINEKGEEGGVSYGSPEEMPVLIVSGEKKECYCEKEFTADKIRIFYGGKSLFSNSNCPLPDDQKTYEELTKWLNRAMEKYEINTCLRKSHFLSQIEAETGFATTLEYDDGWDYDHSTHYDSYREYSLFLKDRKKYKEYDTPKIRRGYRRYLECLNHGHNIKGYGPKYRGRGLIQLTWKDTYETSEIRKSKYGKRNEIEIKKLDDD